jgi:hypothetical protein
MKKQKTIKQYANEAVRTLKAYDKTGSKPWTYKTAAIDLSVQVGSLIKLIMQSEGTRFNHGQTKKEIQEKIGDELADILTEILFISDELGIDMDKAFEKMLKSDEQKISTRAKK